MHVFSWLKSSIEPFVSQYLSDGHSLWGVPFQHAIKEILQVLAQFGRCWVLIKVERLIAHLLLANCGIIVPKWKVCRQKQVQKDSKAKDVDAFSIALCLENFWCDVARGPNSEVFSVIRWSELSCAAKVSKLHLDLFLGLAISDEHIIELNVAVDNVSWVQLIHGIAQLSEDHFWREFIDKAWLNFAQVVQ